KVNIKLVSVLFALLFPLYAQAINEVRDDMFGFNYMLPESSMCISAKESDSKLVYCEWVKGNGYTGDVISYSCMISEFEKYIFFKSRSVCIEQLEIMRSNAP
ncbi:TPA: hypothetical protein ACPVWX_004813, partial [Vibrio parahaemolyticus]